MLAGSLPLEPSRQSCTLRTVHTPDRAHTCFCLSVASCESDGGVAAFVSAVSKVKNDWKLTLSLLSTLDKMKGNDPLIIMTHTMIENSAPRPQLYQQVRPVRLPSTSSPLAVCCALLLLLRRLRPHSTVNLVSPRLRPAAPHPLLLTVIVQSHANTGMTSQKK